MRHLSRHRRRYAPHKRRYAPHKHRYTPHRRRYAPYRRRPAPYKHRYAPSAPLFEHQSDAVRFVLDSLTGPGVVVDLLMGLGKTRIAIESAVRALDVERRRTRVVFVTRPDVCAHIREEIARYTDDDSNVEFEVFSYTFFLLSQCSKMN